MVMMGAVGVGACEKSKSPAPAKEPTSGSGKAMQFDEEEEKEVERIERGTPHELGRPGVGPALIPTAGQLALVPGRTPVFADAKTTAARAHRGRMHMSTAFPAKVIKANAAWTELEFITTDDANYKQARSCHRMPERLDSLRVRVFIPTPTLLYTLAKPLHRSFKDGTAIGLRPGVAVSPVRGSPGRYRAGGGVAVATVDLDTSLLSRSFVPATSSAKWPAFTKPPSGKPAKTQAYQANTVGIINGDKQTLFGHDWDHEGGPPRAWQRGSAVLVEHRTSCYALRALVPADKIQRQVIWDEPRMRKPPGPMVNKGTQLWWPDGRAAGVATANTVIGHRSKTVTNGLSCGRLYFDESESGKPIRLCVKTTATTP